MKIPHSHPFAPELHSAALPKIVDPRQRCRALVKGSAKLMRATAPLCMNDEIVLGQLPHGFPPEPQYQWRPSGVNNASPKSCVNDENVLGQLPPEHTTDSEEAHTHEGQFPHCLDNRRPSFQAAFALLRQDRNAVIELLKSESSLRERRHALRKAVSLDEGMGKSQLSSSECMPASERCSSECSSEGSLSGRHSPSKFANLSIKGELVGLRVGLKLFRTKAAFRSDLQVAKV